MAQPGNAKAALQRGLRSTRCVPNLGKSKSLNILAIAVSARLLQCNGRWSAPSLLSGRRVACANFSKMPHRIIPWRPRAEGLAPYLASGSSSMPRRRRKGRFTRCGSMTSRCARQRAGCLPLRRSRSLEALRRRVGGAARCRRSRQDAADTACQFDHRRRERAFRSGRREGGARYLASGLICYRAGSPRVSSSARRSTGIRSWNGRATLLARACCSPKASCP